MKNIKLSRLQLIMIIDALCILSPDSDASRLKRDRLLNKLYEVLNANKK